MPLDPDNLRLDYAIASLPTLQLDDVSPQVERAAALLDTGDPANLPTPSDATGNAELDSLSEMSEVLTGFRERAQAEQQRYWDAVDSEYWVALCFQTREQKEEFLQKLSLLPLGDKYLDGMAVAQVLGITLEARVPPMPQTRLGDQTWIRLTDSQ